MKILQLIPAFYPAFAYGGTVNVAYNISKELAKRGHDVTVYTSDTIDKTTRQIPRYLEHEGVKIHYYRNISNRLAWKRYVLYPGLIRAIKNNIQNFDVVHLHGTRNFQNMIAAHYAKKYKIPYIVQAHGSVLPFFKKQNLKKLYDLVWGEKILQNASKCIALTKTESDQYIKMGVPEDRIAIIPNGLDLSQFSNLPERGIFRSKYGISDNCKIILYIGRLHGSKGLDLLIDAFNKVIQERENFQLVIIGPDDGYLRQIKSKTNYLGSQDKIKIIGFIPNNEKIQALIDSDVFVTPSYSGFPVTFLEACACGLPIITSTHGDNLNWIHNNVGFVVEYNSSKLRDAILKLVDDEDLSRKFSNQGKRLVAGQFNWNAICDIIEMQYRDVIINEKK